MTVRIVKTLDGNKRRLFLFLGAMWHTAYGFVFMFAPTPPTRQAGFNWLPYGVDENELSWIWIVAGVVTGFIAIYPKKRTRAENVAYGILLIPSLFWVSIYITSFILGNPLGLFQAFQFSWFWMILYVSGWPNPVLVHLDVDRIMENDT